MFKYIGVGLGILIAALFAYTLFGNEAEATSSYNQRGQVTVKCLSLTGDTVQTYNGNNQNISWYGDGTYIEVRLTDRIIRVPQFRCEYTEFR
ncbi:hypothetical protein Acj9p006 [Acinetobacter phage Acj9]|uniref:Uncharacterized protein n=1 Tax=Acinetobacter phage Acj9 TaxID=760939 RepID=E5EPE0_9CAUD|nr:hypothetical protein Acj9p006 [Acinetobacter phage Acj9]ADG59906.1 hypothetical protein Acj9p006 [Acinetobacter phage Acj9]